MKPALKPSLFKLLAVGALFYSSYGLSNFLASRRASVPEIAFDWERGIPFWAWTVIPYWSLNLMYAAAFFLCRDTREQNRYILRLVAAQLAATACFLLFPLHFSWPKPPYGGISGWLFDALLAFDLPYNQAPSLHIALALIVGAFYWRRFPKIRLPLVLWQSLIALSVLTTYQHHFIDVPTGALLGVLVLWALPQQGRSPFRRPPERHGHTDRGRLKLARRYLAGAFAAALPALAGGAWLWLLWLSAALLAVAFAYFAANPAVFQKRPDGTLSPAAAALLLPYLAAVRLNAAFWLRGKARTAQVRDGLFIGSILGAKGFPAVLDLCAEYPCRHTAAEYRSLPLPDLLLPSAEILAQAAAQAEQMRRTHGRVLVCCALGYGRSAAVVLAWLTAYGGCKNAAEAAAVLQQVRPQAVLAQKVIAAADAAAGRLKTQPRHAPSGFQTA
ncbi:Predicted protein tyrosine phosphatase [Kingella potus]|uniref:Tyrosine specific protein phosphatases domain-containing protein n=1 Tax=Kingella potus TaxID=265175 RepID=A0A377R2G9_9NEIS|nr:phosphatase PAP2/dual specificity phosphatase family protein [Kingella potus]STR03090.1 Predicted protein tyrosine phosphatase [Kingella potus]